MKKINLKNAKGITLITVIITIIVMLTIAAIVFNLAIDSEIFNSTEEAKFKSEIRQMQEYIGDIKSAVIIDNEGVEPDSYNIEELMENVPEDIKTKYNEKLSLLNDGILYYNPWNLEDKEVEWCIQLGLLPTRIKDFIKYSSSKNYNKEYFWTVDTEFTGAIELEKVKNEVLKNYPNAKVAYLAVNDTAAFFYSGEEYRKLKEVMEKIDKLHKFVIDLGKDRNSEITEADLVNNEEIKTIINDLKLTIPLKVSKINATASLYKSFLFATVGLVVVNGDEQIATAVAPELQDIFEEFVNKFDFTKAVEISKTGLTFEPSTYLSDSDDGEFPFKTSDLKVTGIAENEKKSNIVVPGYVVNSLREIQAVREIETKAFLKPIEELTTKANKLNVIKMIKIEETYGVEKYTDLTLAQIKGYMSGVTSGKSDSISIEGWEETEENKTKLIKLSLSKMMYLPEEKVEEYFIEENGTLYAILSLDATGNPTIVYTIYQMDEEGNYKLDEKGNKIKTPSVEFIETLTVEEGIFKIGANAFEGNMLYEMRFPTTIEDATDAFTGIVEIGTIYTKADKNTISKIDGCGFGLPTYWYEYFEFNVE